MTASRVEAVFDVEASRSLSEEQKRRVTARLGPVVRATAQDTRSQARNRELALERLRSRLGSAALVVQRRAGRRSRRGPRGAPGGRKAAPRRAQAGRRAAGADD